MMMSQRRRIIGGGGGGGGVACSVMVDAVTRWIIVWVVCIQIYSWRLIHNNNNDASSTTSTSSFLVVQGATFFRPFGVFSSATTSASASAALAARTVTDTKQYEDGNTTVDLQQQAAQTKEEEDENLSPTDDEIDKENVDCSNPRAARSNIASNDEKEEEEASWFHDMEFEDYNEATATLAVDTSSSSTSSSSGVASALLDDDQLHPMLQIPLAVSLHDVHNNIHKNNNKNKNNHPILRAVRAYCDSGATRTVMSYESARRLGWLTHLDRRYAGQATSVGGSCRVLGRLPAGLVDFHLHHINKPGNNNDHHDRRMITLQSPTITVLEDLPSSSTICDDHDDDGNGGFELLLGLDFLREYQAILDLRHEELRLLVKRKEYSIPFLRPRSSGSASTSSTISCDAAHDDTTTIQDHGRKHETHASSTSNAEHRWSEFIRGGRSPFDDDDDDDDNDDDYEDFDHGETLDMSGV